MLGLKIRIKLKKILRYIDNKGAIYILAYILLISSLLDLLIKSISRNLGYIEQSIKLFVDWGVNNELYRNSFDVVWY